MISSAIMHKLTSRCFLRVGGGGNISFQKGEQNTVHLEYHSHTSLSPRPNWDPTHPLSRKPVCLSPRNQGDTPLERGWAGPNSDDWSKSQALCLLCVENIRFRPKYRSLHLYSYNL